MARAKKIGAAAIARILKGNELLEQQKNFLYIMETLRDKPVLSLRLWNILAPAPQLHTQCL
jgi:hypothetical protein